MKYLKCPLCNSDDSRFLFYNNNYKIVRCNNCRLVYLNYFPDINDIKQYYSMDFFSGGVEKEAYYDYIGEYNLIRKNFYRRIYDIEKIRSGKTILDIGCAAGFFLDVARERGWQTYGVEISDFACKYAREKLKLDVVCGDFLDFSSMENYFDVITLWDTFEHLRYPIKILQKAHRLLKEGGLLVISTGNVDSLFSILSGKFWHIYSSPQHLYYFSKRTISALLKKTGFKVINITHKGRWFSLNFILHRLSYWTKLKFFTKCNLNNNIKIYINLFDIMTVYAIK